LRRAAACSFGCDCRHHTLRLGSATAAVRSLRSSADSVADTVNRTHEEM
jgi:hypothetical protein